MIKTQKQRIIKVRPLREIQNLLQDPNYNEYYHQRQELLEKFGKKITEMNREEYRVWLHEVSALLLEANGGFQKFLWENEPEDKKLKVEKMLRRGTKRNTNWWREENETDIE